MRRGQSRDDRNEPLLGFTKQELVEASKLSSKTFDTIRKAARIRGPGHGGRNWVFSVDDVVMLIRRAESGTFSERGGPAATAWRALLDQAGVPFDEPPRR
jgi:hypothetical protein